MYHTLDWKIVVGSTECACFRVKWHKCQALGFENARCSEHLQGPHLGYCVRRSLSRPKSHRQRQSRWHLALLGYFDAQNDQKNQNWLYWPCCLCCVQSQRFVYRDWHFDTPSQILRADRLHSGKFDDDSRQCAASNWVCSEFEEWGCLLRGFWW